MVVSVKQLMGAEQLVALFLKTNHYNMMIVRDDEDDDDHHHHPKYWQMKCSQSRRGLYYAPGLQVKL